MLFGATTLALGASDPKTKATKQTPLITAHEEVRIGNEKLLAGSAEEALQSYARAEALKPDAAEIAFVEGLANFRLKRFDQARDAFQKAAAARDSELATDAMYALGACDHAEALENTGQLLQAISQIESAMKQYRQVLTENPNHAVAIEANRKAASSWRRLKKRLEQQQQEQQSDSDNQNEQQDKDKERQDNENQGNDSQQEQQDNIQPSQQKDNQQKKQEEESQKQQDAADKKKESQEQKQADKKQKEQITRQQAKRRLREMMEALLQRNKNRQKPIELIPARPVEKDW